MVGHRENPRIKIKPVKVEKVIPTMFESKPVKEKPVIKKKSKKLKLEE